MARKKVNRDEPKDDEWLATYSDCVTLLMTFFVLLYAMSSVDEIKMRALSQAFRTVMAGEAGDTILEYSLYNGDVPLIGGEIPTDTIDGEKIEESMYYQVSKFVDEHDLEAVVDIIDIRYWHYKTDGIFAPEGGKNMAPRQHMRKMKVGKVTFTEAYKAVNEYRRKFPEKAVTFYAQNYPAMGWAVFMAGGSCPVIPCKDKAFLKDAAVMEVEETDSEDYKKMVKSGIGSIIYSNSGVEVPVQLSSGKYILRYIHPDSGEMEVISKSLKINNVYTLKVPDGKEGVYWFHRL